MVKASYDLAAKFELKVSDVEFLRTAPGRQLMARVYQPQGPGPFPTVLDLHGGAWRRKDRLAEEPMDRAIAASGALVVAIDLRLSEEAPYPASVQDANYGVRWLKWRAAEWGGDASRLGVYGSSSGGHRAMLFPHRPGVERVQRARAYSWPSMKCSSNTRTSVSRAPGRSVYCRSSRTGDTSAMTCSVSTRPGQPERASSTGTHRATRGPVETGTIELP
jgi:acetyl esterase/lipase